MVDVARAVFEPKGIKVIYKNVPWKRASAGTKSGTYNGAIGASHGDAEGFIFPKEELTRNFLAFYTKKDFDWKFDGLSSIEMIRLGVIGGYDYRPWLGKHIKENLTDQKKIQTLTGDKPLQRNIQKLLKDRIDVVVDTEAAIRWEAKSIGVLDDIKSGGYGDKVSYCYIAFSPNLDSSKKYAKMLSEGIVELRKSGKLKIILDKYGLEDWK